MLHRRKTSGVDLEKPRASRPGGYCRGRIVKCESVCAEGAGLPECYGPSSSPGALNPAMARSLDEVRPVAPRPSATRISHPLVPAAPSPSPTRNPLGILELREILRADIQLSYDPLRPLCRQRGFSRRPLRSLLRTRCSTTGQPDRKLSPDTTAEDCSVAEKRFLLAGLRADCAADKELTKKLAHQGGPATNGNWGALPVAPPYGPGEAMSG